MKPSEIRDALASAVLWILGISSVTAGIILGIEEHASASATLFAGGALLLLFANMAKLESFKGLGIEAKTREIKESLAHADEILLNLRDVLKTTARFTLQSIARQGRWDGHIPPHEAYPIVKSFEAQLKRANIDAAEIEEIVAPWYDATARDILHAGLQDAGKYLQQKIESVESTINALPFPAGDDVEKRERQSRTLEVEQLKETARRLLTTLTIRPASIPAAIEAELRTNTVLSDHEKAQLRGIVAAPNHQALELLRTKTLPMLPP